MDKMNKDSTTLKNQLFSKKKSKVESLDSNVTARFRQENTSIGKTVSCSELPTSVKSYSHSNLESHSMFFNKKGWPVKVMRVTETSLPKAIKPVPTRSLPSTSCHTNTNIRKEKSLYTQKKVISAKFSKEDKENSSKCIKEKDQPTKEQFNNSSGQVQEQKSDIVGGLDSDIKAVLDHLDETVNKFSSEKLTDPDHGKKIHIKETTTKKTVQELSGKKTSRSEKNENLSSARSNKYNSREMKAYIQAKRCERKQQLSEEAKKKQAMLELQKKNLEKLREKASLVLKKSSTKTVEESKPRWQGPLGDDNSETSAPAIHIFETKIPTAKKPKLSAKSETSEQCIQNVDKYDVDNELTDKEDSKHSNLEYVNEQLPNKVVTKNINMEKGNLNKNRDSKLPIKLRLSRNKFPVDDPRILSAMEQAVAEHSPQCGNDFGTVRNSIDELIQTTKCVNEWTHNQSAPIESNSMLLGRNDDRRKTFNISKSAEEELIMPPENSLRKRHQSSQLKSDDMLSKKMRDTESPQPSHGNKFHGESIENALKKVQQQIMSNQKEGKDREWLHSFIKPDAFSMMNVIKMKRLSCKTYDSYGLEKKDRLKQKVITVRPSIEDETDAPSIISMEEDFKILPEPLRLSDMCLPTTVSGSTVDWTPHSSVSNSHTNKKVINESLKTSKSSFANEAPPLVVPESVQHLKLRLRRTPDELSSSLSFELQSQYTTSELPTSERAPVLSADKQLGESPIHMSSRVTYDKFSAQQQYNNGDTQHEPVSTSNCGQIEIGQVLTSPVSSRSILSSRIQPVSERPCSTDITSESSHHTSIKSVEELCSNQEISNGKPKEVLQMQRAVTSSQSCTSLSTSSHKNLQLFKVLIEDALFQKEQYDLMYRTQEDVLQANYKAALAELDLKVRNVPSSLDSESPDKEVEVRNKIETFYRRARSNIRRTKNHVISNWMKRIDDLQKEKDQLEKQMKSKRFKLRSAEASPKKVITLHRSSATSVVENSSSSESSVSTQHFDDKKRHENDKGLVLKQKKAEKELLKKRYEEEKQKVQEIEKVERSLKSGRSRRDKSTSPLQSVQEASTRDVACSVQEDIQSISHHLTSSSLQSVEEARGTGVYNSESFESPESSETPRQPRMINRPFVASKPFIAARLNSKSKMLIKVPLSPCMQLCTKRRGSSGSDESLLLSQNETQSEQSDYEVKISALKEQKRQRLMILNRLNRELKKAQKELLKATEASLIKQIQVYDSYIDQTKKQLAEVTEEVSAKKIVRPQIKHPRVSDKFLPRTSDVLQKTPTVEAIEDNKQQENVVSDIETNSIKTVSEASSTETTIQSSGPAQIKEELSSEEIISKEEINNEENANNELCSPLQSENMVSEVLNSAATEASNIPSVELSNGSVISEITEDRSRSTISNTTNTKSVEDESQWMDAEEFFGQLENLEKVSCESLKDSKVSARNFSSSQDSNKSQSLTSILTNASIENIFHQDKTESKESVESSKISDPVIEEFSDSSTNEQNNEEKFSNNKSTIGSISDNLDIGSVVSIISQVPSPQKVKCSESELLDIDNEPTSTILDTKSDHKSNLEVLSGNDDDQTASICASEKSNIPEIALLNNSLSLDASISSDINTTSQNSTPCISDNEDIDPSESGVIKVFVCNKTQVIDKHVDADGKNEQMDKTFIISNDEKMIKNINEEMVDKITDYLVNKLLSECVKEKLCKNETENKSTNSDYIISSDKNSNSTLHESSINNFTKNILNKFLKDATDCMLKINESKKLVQINLSNVFNKTEGKSSPNKLLDALALESNSVSLDIGHGDDSVEPENKLENNLNCEVELAEGNDSEVFWLDEDIPHPVSLQAQREAEELRIKQLQIEREIKQLEQAQENIPSYYYVREIPNKPPPPYTPPQPQPTRQEDIENLAAIATQSLVAAWKRGDDLTSIQPSQQYSSKRVGSQVFKKFMFDLVKQIFVDITSSDGNEKGSPPWETTVCRLKHLVLPELTEDSVNSFVLKRVRVLFGFEPSYMKENLIIQWSRKKRDRVDELLVRESQEEKQEWTDYSKYEVAVKNSVALNIFDILVDETTLAISDAFQKKLSYSQQSC